MQKLTRWVRAFFLALFFGRKSFYTSFLNHVGIIINHLLVSFCSHWIVRLSAVSVKAKTKKSVWKIAISYECFPNSFRLVLFFAIFLCVSNFFCNCLNSNSKEDFFNVTLIIRHSTGTNSDYSVIGRLLQIPKKIMTLVYVYSFLFHLFFYFSVPFFSSLLCVCVCVFVECCRGVNCSRDFNRWCSQAGKIHR